MAGVKISNLPAIVTPAMSDIFAVVQGGVTYKETITQLGTLLLPLTGGTLTGNLTLFGDPSTNLMAATKQYVDAVATGLNIQEACRVASTTALTVTYANGASGVGATLTNAGAQAAIAIDGVTLALNDRVLIKNQASTLQNGIYTVSVLGSGATNWVLTRATDFDTPAEVQPGDLVSIIAGSTQASSSWMETATVVTIGTDPIVFIQFSASLPITVPNGGTGRTTSTTAYGLIAAGTTATGSLQTLPTGTAGQILQSAGAAALPAYSTATYPSLATSAARILRADGTNWAQTTSTFADTYAASGVLYANGANNVAGLATGNNGMLVTDGTGVPSISSTPPSAVLANIPGRLVAIQVFTATGANTYTPTAGVSNAFVELWGAGGGGSSSNSALIFGSGGGAGAYSASFVAVSGAVSISIGAGGDGRLANNGTAGTDGGDTTYNTTTIVAKGGTHAPAGNSNGSGGAAASGTGTIKINGGDGNVNTQSAAGFICGGGNSPRNAVMPSIYQFSTSGLSNSGQGGCAGNNGNPGGAGGSGYAIVYEYS